ncbi:beta-1,3-glucanase family protein [Francisella sciaenopsi]|uniref:GH64 domain-containing protein n=1 Tax=Francisella sciaenopsi TaxID=3055034 RepID=A0ABQ6PFW2_9GAMM
MKKVPLGLTVAISATLLTSCGSNHRNENSLNLENQQIDSYQYTDLNSSQTMDLKTTTTDSVNTYPLKIINNSNVSEDTYITVIDGTNIYTVADDGSLTKGSLLNNAYFQDYSKNIGNKGDFTIKLPDPFVSGRIYVSIGHPLGGVATDAPFYSTSSTDNSFYMSQVVYDKFELTWKDGILYIDPTSVDFFGIPLTIQNPSPIKATDLTESGYPLGMSWKEIIDQAKNAFPEGVSSENSDTLNKLIFNSPSGSTIRIISPSGIATSPNANNSLGSLKNLANKPASSEPSYLLNKITTPSGDSSYLQNLISYYEDASKHQLAFDVGQLYDSKYPQTDIFKNVVYFADGISNNNQCSQQISSYDGEGRPIYGAYADSSSCWEFIPKVCSDLSNLLTCKTPTIGDQAKLQNEYIPMDYVSSFDFFSPGQWPFDNNNILPKVYTTVDTIQDNHPAKGLIAEGLSALFSAGLLPVSNSDIEKTAISKSSLNKLVNSNDDILYKDNSANGQLEDKGPWFSQYSKVVHSICYDSATKAGCTTSTSATNRKYPIVYTFAFDDFLAQDGTLTSNTTANDSTISVTINDMQGYPKTNPGAPPKPDLKVSTPNVISGSTDECSNGECTLTGIFTSANTPDQMEDFSVSVTPQSYNGGNNCQLSGGKWYPCGAIANVISTQTTKVSGPDSNSNYKYMVTSKVDQTSFEGVATGATWHHCSGSTTLNQYKYYILVSDGTSKKGATSTSYSTYPDIKGVC